MAEKTLKVTAAQIEESVEKSHNHSNLSTLNNITSSRMNEWDDKADKEHRHNASEIDGIENLDVDLSNYYTKTQVDNKIATEMDSIDLSSYAKKSEIPNATSDLTNDSNFATQSFVTNKIAEASLSGGNVDLSGYATKDELNTKANISAIPTKTSQLTNDSNYLTSVPSEYVTDTELNNITGVLSTLETSNKSTIVAAINELFRMVSNLQTPQQPQQEYMYYGRLSAVELNVPPIIQYSQITADKILNGKNITKVAPSTIGKTSMGLASTTVEGDYVVVAVPKSKGYTVTKDNGIGGKMIFDEETAGANGIDIKINGIDYTLWGEILLTQGELFIYID